MEPHLPVLDLSPFYGDDRGALDALAREVDRCLIADGFLLVVGHRVPDGVRRLARAKAMEFFRQPLDRKERAMIADRRGWVPSGHEATGYASGEESLPDLKESFTLGREVAGDGFEFRRNPWDAAGVDGFREAMVAYLDEMLRLGADLMRLFALALGVDDDHLTSLSNHSDSEFNLNWYPPLTSVPEPLPGQFRIGPHADYGCCTILDRQPGVAGLQIQTREGDWIDAPVAPGSYTINVGDLLARMTGERWRSTLHRVLPPSSEAPTEELLSLVFFHEFDADALIETLAPPIGGGAMFEPVVADDYITAKFDAVTL